ncbi:MAG: sel1 repeat family protein, partial [Thermoguttaceae bacterium]|nr:sel1 repeat family protein [Thermoguttaceae bacterium]
MEKKAGKRNARQAWWAIAAALSVGGAAWAQETDANDATSREERLATKLLETSDLSEEGARRVARILAEKPRRRPASSETPSSAASTFSPSDVLLNIPKASPEAERLYLEGRALRYGLNGSQVDRKRGLELLEQAMKLGSLNAQAEVALAYWGAQNGLAASMTAFNEEIFIMAHTPATLGNPYAQEVLAALYAMDGPKKNKAKAEELRKSAFENMLRLAEAGDAFAAFKVAGCYVNGAGVEKNLDEAGAWIRKSAEADCAIGMRGLANWWEASGNGREAFEQYRKAAEKGEPISQYNLGFFYRNGDEPVEKDLVKASEWWQKASEAGDSDAMIQLADLYANDAGGEMLGEPDWAKAHEWLLKAAQMGNSYAMGRLSLYYAYGRGCAQSWEKANE